MNSFHIEAKASNVWCNDENLYIALYDGRQLSVPLAYFPRLLHASPQQRSHYELSGGGLGFIGMRLMKILMFQVSSWAIPIGQNIIRTYKGYRLVLYVLRILVLSGVMANKALHKTLSARRSFCIIARCNAWAVLSAAYFR